MEEKKFVIVIPSYNNSQWYEKNILSAVGQKYNNFKIIYTDDASADNTGNLVEDFINKNKLSDKVTLVKNAERKGALENLYNMIHGADDTDIIVHCDGDDWFAHSNILSKLNNVYQNDKIWMTWGSYLDSNGMTRGCCRPADPNIVKAAAYRKVPWYMSHCRTHYAKLFKKVNKGDLLFNDGTFYKMGWDLSFMIPMAEMSAGRATYVDDILYIYNNNNPISDHKVNQQMQATMDRHIRQKKPYQKLENLF